MKPPYRPQLRDLLRVIAIGQSQDHENLVITPLALEVYADGCLLTLLFQRTRVAPVPTGLIARVVFIGYVDVTMTDDCGGVYSGQLHEHSGSSDSEFWQGRGQCACTPTLDPEARALRIEIPAVEWTYREETEQGDIHRVEGDITHGPWIYSIQLPAGRA